MHALLPLVLIVLNVVVFVRLKTYRMFLEILPFCILIVVFAATWRDRLVAWRVL
jgi:hypothetical protein